MLSFSEIKDNPILSARYFGWIRDKQGRKIPFFPNETQQKYSSIKRMNKDAGKKARFLVLKARRMGLTTQEQWENLNRILFNKNQSVITVAHESQSTELIFEIAKFFYNNLHPKLQAGEIKLNKREIKIPSPNNSQFYIGTAGAVSFGRGQTIQKAHCSEVAFWPGTPNEIDNFIIGISEAASHGEVVLETTANGRNNWFYHAWIGAKKKENSWIPIFFPWFEDKTYISTDLDLINLVRDTLDEEEKNLIEEYKCTLPQLAWRREKVLELRGKQKFDQEYPKNDIVAFLASGSCFFDVDMIRALIDQVKPPLSRQECLDSDLFLLNDDITYWYKPDPKLKYIAATDTAGGAINEKSNWCVTTIYEKSSLKQVARLRTKMAPDDFARFNCKYFLPQFKNTFAGLPKWAIERNNHGHSVINTAYNECGYPNLYSMVDHLKNKLKGLGWETNNRSRPMMLDDLNDFLWSCYNEYRNHGITGIINDIIFLEECLNFIDNEGKYEAASGCFDDTIFPWGIGLQAGKQAEITIDFI